MKLVAQLDEDDDGRNDHRDYLYEKKEDGPDDGTIERRRTTATSRRRKRADWRSLPGSLSKVILILDQSIVCCHRS